jgi:hypothetical protein
MEINAEEECAYPDCSEPMINLKKESETIRICKKCRGKYCERCFEKIIDEHDGRCPNCSAFIS